MTPYWPTMISDDFAVTLSVLEMACCTKSILPSTVRVMSILAICREFSSNLRSRSILTSTQLTDSTTVDKFAY